jgi:hypothetical protein
MSSVAGNAKATTLAQSYEQSRGVFVAQVLGCADDAIRDNGKCEGNRYFFEAIEVLKEANPWIDFSGVYPRETSQTFLRGCRAGIISEGAPCFGRGFTLGATYLIFLNETGEIDWSISGDLTAIDNEPVPPPSKSQILQAYLTILRDYRDGRIDDLAEPWFLIDSGDSCRLEHNVERQQISFSLSYDDSRFRREFKKEDLGNGLQRWVKKTPEQAPMGLITQELVIPEIQFGTLSFSARFREGMETMPDTAKISIGERSWSLRTSTLKVRNNGAVMVSVVQDMLQGDAAQEVFDAMLEPVEITVTKHASPQEPRGVSRTPLIEIDDPLIQTRSTQFASQAEEFASCIDRN